VTDPPNDPSESATVAIKPPAEAESGVSLSDVASLSSTGVSVSGGALAGRYQNLHLLGRGGMGAVHRVKDTELDEIVALEVLESDSDDTPQLVERFRREVELARRVTHPNVARTFDIGEHDGTKVLTMEHIEGQSLSDLAAHGQKLPLPRLLEIATAVCEGLAAARRGGALQGPGRRLARGV
jgi:serine/threonine-protein kinase